MELVSHVAPPRQHIWSFTNSLEEQSRFAYATCPCVTGSTNANNIPSFVGQNYFCETGITSGYANSNFYSNGVPLWDGLECGPISSCCTFNSPPWFNVTLSAPTTDYIEVRICANHGNTVADSPIQLIELYVKWTGHDQHCEQTGICMFCS